MVGVPGKQSGLTFQAIAARLSKHKLNPLVEIKKAYPHIPLEKLPDGVKREVQGILDIGINAASRTQLSADYNSLFSIIAEDCEQ